jgi:uncharacterized integral membrane protein
MKPRTVLILALLVLIGLFALLNWRSFTAPTNLDFLVARIEAPLGVLMLIVVGILVVVFLLLLAKAEIASLLESRKAAKELESVRKLVAEDQLSRVETLRASVHGELGEINRKLDLLLGKRGSGPGVV